MDCAGFWSPSVAQLVANSRIGERTEQLAMTRAAFVPLTARPLQLEDAYGRAKRAYVELVKKIRIEKKMGEDHTIAEQNGDLSRYHGVLRSVWGIFNAADKGSASHNDTLSLLRILFEEGHKVKVVFLSTGPSQNEIEVVKLEHAFEAEKELELPTVPGLATETATVRTEATRLRGSVETPRLERKEVVVTILDVRDLTGNSKKIRADAEAFMKRKTKLESETSEKGRPLQ